MNRDGGISLCWLGTGSPARIGSGMDENLCANVIGCLSIG